MAFSRDELAAYEKQTQKMVDDRVSPFRGATPAKAADPAAIAAVASGQTNTTPGGGAAAAAPASSSDDSPVVDEDGTTGDPTESGEGTSDVTSAASSTAAVDPGDETDPNQDLTGEAGAEEAASTRPAPKKGSAAERIVEVLDLAEGYKEYGRMKEQEVLDLRAQLAQRNGTQPAANAAPPAAEPTVESMPDMADDDVQFDMDKYRAKMTTWMAKQTAHAAQVAVREALGTQSAETARRNLEAKIETYAKDHPDFETVVATNPVLAANQLAPDAAAIVAESDHTAEMLYRFGKDPKLAVRVARQHPRDQIVTVTNMIRDIEDERKAHASGQRSAGSQGGAKPAQKKSITQASPPPRPVTGAGRVDRDVTDPNMSMDEFARMHRARKQAAREAGRTQRGLA